MTLAAYDQILAILTSARERKQMYFQPMVPSSVFHWIHGLRTGFAFVRLDWSPEHRRPAVEQRGLSLRAAANEALELQERGLSDEAIIDELLAIEIDMWQSQRTAAANSAPSS